MLVVTHRGSNVRPTALTSDFSRVVKESKVELFTFHDLKAMDVSDFDGDNKLASRQVSGSTSIDNSQNECVSLLNIFDSR